MSNKKKWIPIGKVLREWGIRGQVRCVSFNLQSNLYSQLEKIYLGSEEARRPFLLQEAKPHGKYWLLKFSGYEDPETARELRGLTISVPREELPPLETGEIYLSDMEGMAVLGPQGNPLGEIIEFQRVGDSEVMVVGQDPDNTVLVPYESGFVKSTSWEKRTLTLTDYAMELFNLNRHDKTI